MNKLKFILSLAGITLFTSCTSDEIVSGVDSGLTPKEKSAIIAEAGQNSDIPISIGSGAGGSTMNTRALLESDANNLFETPSGQYLGVYCLASGKQSGAPNISEIPTSDSDIIWGTTPTTYAKWLDNIPAKVVKYAQGAGPFTAHDYSDVQFMANDLSASKIYYYPFGNWYHYDFYAYYPRATGADVTCADKYVRIRYNIDGKQDIIHAKASSTDNTYLDALPYCAKYIRKCKDAGQDEYDILPHFNFTHKLTQFYFKIKPNNADAAELHTKGFELTGMTLKNVCYKLYLTVASRDPNYTEGQLVLDDAFKDLKVWDKNNDTDPFDPDGDGNVDPIPVAADSNGNLDNSTKDIGYIMVPPSALIAGKTYNEYQVNIKMAQASGEDVPSTIVPLTPPTGGFLEGHKYTITLEIFSPTKIQARATLNSWESEPDTNIEVH